MPVLPQGSVSKIESISSMPSDQKVELEHELMQEILAGLSENGIQTEEELRLFAKLLTSFDDPSFEIPQVQVCSDHCTPMDFLIWDILGPGGTSIVEANRDGFKTFILSVANIIRALGRKASVLHLGAVQQQAQNGNKYVDRLLKISALDQFVTKKTTVETHFSNGTELQIHPCTISKTNSPRMPAVRLDEGDLADPTALKESKGVMSSDRNGNPPSWTMVSSRKFANGNMAAEIKRAKKSGGKIFRWCYKEVTERCPDERSGTEPTIVYVDMTNLEWLTQEEYQALEMSEKNSKDEASEGDKLYFYKPFHVFDKCIECPILGTCRGELKKAGGPRPINDLILTFNGWDREDWISQKECRNVPSTARIFRAFSQDRNVHEFPIWRSRKTGEFMGKSVWGKDWGYEHPDVTLMAQKTLGVCGHEHLWVHDETYVYHKDDEEVLDHLVAIKWIALDGDGLVLPLNQSPAGTLYGAPDIVCADPSSPKSRKTYRNHGFYIPKIGAIIKKKVTVKDGLRVCRSLIHPIDCTETHLHVHPRCERFISDMEQYSFKLDSKGEPTEEPAKGGPDAPDHGADGFRMIATAEFMGRRAWLQEMPLPEDDE